MGQAFELAYKKFLETKQAQEDFKKLKEMLKTASPQERVEIERKLAEVNKIRAAEAERQKKIAAIQAKMTDPNAKPLTKITVKGTQGESFRFRECGQQLAWLSTSMKKMSRNPLGPHETSSSEETAFPYTPMHAS